MANVNDININPKLVKIPTGFSNLPQVGKIQQLYDLNNNDLYKRLSPFTPNSGLLSFGPRQPFVYVSPNKGRKGINGLKRFESRIFPIGSALQDVQRIAQFMVTGKGILFLTKQFLLQRTQPFNETRTYNPLSVINAVVRPVTGFILPPPIRHLSGGVLGALASLVGINVSSDKPIKGTAATGNPDILPKFEQTVHANRYGKGFTGLIRGGTAASAYYVKKPAGALGGLINFAKKLFGGTVNQPPGTKFRADEAYPVFDLKAKKEFGSYTKDGVLDELHQRWYNNKDSLGKSIIDDPGNEHRLKFPKARQWPDNNSFPIAYAGGPRTRASTFADASDSFQGQEIGGILEAKYEDTIFANSSNPYARSEIILIYKKYVEHDASSEGRKLYNKIPRNLSPGFDYFAKGSKGYISQLDTDGTHKLLFFRTARLTKGTYEATIDRYDDGFDKIPLPKKIEYLTAGPSSDKTPLTRRREELEKSHPYYSSMTGPAIPRNNTDGKGGFQQFKNNEYSASIVLNDARNVKGTYSNKVPDKSPSSPLITKREKAKDPSHRDEPKKLSELKKNPFEVVDKLQTILETSIYNVEKYNSEVDLNYTTLMARRKSPFDQTPLPEDGYQKRLKKREKFSQNFSLEDNRGKGFAGTGKSDYVNSLQILNRSDIDSHVFKPYESDQIAFYFHDLVNDKYIPFRSTVTGINDQNTAKWTEINYIGRSDRMWNYTGFSRNIGFGFKVAAMSISELLPMWSRINYLIGLTRPSNYKSNTTKIGKSDAYDSSFAIPPLVTFTIGDLYKEQPLILENVTITIPEDSIWETLPENHNANWDYLGGKITWDDSKGKFAQFPLECVIAISGQLLERETPRTGKNNFADVADFGNNASKTFSNNMGFNTSI